MSTSRAGRLTWGRLSHRGTRSPFFVHEYLSTSRLRVHMTCVQKIEICSARASAPPHHRVSLTGRGSRLSQFNIDI